MRGKGTVPESPEGVQESHNGQEGRQVSKVSVEPLDCRLAVEAETNRTSTGEHSRERIGWNCKLE